MIILQWQTFSYQEKKDSICSEFLQYPGEPDISFQTSGRDCPA